MADTKTSALTELSVPDLADLLYAVDDTGPTSYKLTNARALGLLRRGACEGRLTPTTAVPYTTADVIGATTLYWSPIDAGLITLYDGTRWLAYLQAELSLALSGLTSGANYDAFLDYNAGTPALVLGPVWTNDTTRATGLTTQNGIQVLSGTTTKRYVGTIRTTGTTTTEESGGTAGTSQVGGKRFVWNKYNRIRRWLRVADGAANWTYATATWRVANGATAPLNCVEYVVGDAAVSVRARVNGGATAASNSVGSVGIGLDSSTAIVTGLLNGQGYSTGTGQQFSMIADYEGYPGLGYHSLRWIERGTTGTSTFGGFSSGIWQTGLLASLDA